MAVIGSIVSIHIDSFRLEFVSRDNAEFRGVFHFTELTCGRRGMASDILVIH
jgi:hypothetical protein